MDAESFAWQGKILSAKSFTSESLVKQMIWEVAELNFHLELITLDEKMSEYPVDTCLILECFPSRQHTVLSVANIKTADQGLRVVSLKSRAPYFLVLQDLMLRWKEIRSMLAVDITLKNWKTKATSHLQAVEEAVASIYTQMFYGLYGCPSIIPHYILV